MMTSYRSETEAEEIPLVVSLRLRGSLVTFIGNPEWRHCVCSSSALRSATPIVYESAPDSSDWRLSIDDTMPSLVEVTVNISGPGLYITLPLVLRSARLREEVARFPGRNSPWPRVTCSVILMTGLENAGGPHRNRIQSHDISSPTNDELSWTAVVFSA